MSEYTTMATFNGKEQIDAGTDVTAKDLGLSDKDCARYVELGLLVVKPKAKGKAAAGQKAPE